MSEPNRNNRTIKEIITDATDRELEDYETGLMTPEKLRGLAAAENRRKKFRYRKIAGLAALFLVVIVSAVMVFNSMTSDVDADKNHKEEIITDGGVVIEDGGWGSSSEDNWTVTDWDEVKTVKATIPELAVPEYIPEGYEFKKLIVKEGDPIRVEYLFDDSYENELVIYQFIYTENLNATHIENNDRAINSARGKIYIKESLENNKATIQIDDGNIVDIWSILTDNEVLKIIENMH